MFFFLGFWDLRLKLMHRIWNLKTDKRGSPTESPKATEDPRLMDSKVFAAGYISYRAFLAAAWLCSKEGVWVFGGPKPRISSVLVVLILIVQWIFEQPALFAD